MNNNLRKLVGKNIKKARKEKKWTQSDLAKIINYSRTYVTEIENGNTTIEIERLSLFSRIFNKEPIYFLSDFSDR